MIASRGIAWDAMANRLGWKGVEYALGAAVEARCPNKAMGGNGRPGQVE
jgi:hypothetical protein